MNHRRRPAARPLRLLLTPALLTIALLAAMTLPVHAATTVIVSGSVVNGTGQPIVNAEVSATWGYESYAVRTNEAGAFYIPAPPGVAMSLSFTTRQSGDGFFRVTSQGFTPVADTYVGTITPPALSAATYRVVDSQGVPVYRALLRRETGALNLDEDNWATVGAALSQTLVVRSGLWNQMQWTDAAGEAVLHVPDLLPGVRPVDFASFTDPDGRPWFGDMEAATGTNPVVVSMPTLSVTAPRAPTDLAVADTTGYQGALARTRVSWTGSKEFGAKVTGYTVTAQPGGVRASAQTDPGSPSERPSATFEGLTSGTYTFTVVAHSSVGDSAPVTSSPFLVSGHPVAPANVRAIPGVGSATVSWDPVTSTPVTNYLVRLSTGEVQGVPASTTSVVFSNLRTAVTRTASVTAVNQSMQGPVATSAPFLSTLPVAASVPGRMRPPKVVIRGRKAIVKWKPAPPNGSAITRYRISVRKGITKNVRGSLRKTTLTLKPGKYRLRIAARNAVGFGRSSLWVTFRVA